MCVLVHCFLRIAISRCFRICGGEHRCVIAVAFRSDLTLRTPLRLVGLIWIACLGGGVRCLPRSDVSRTRRSGEFLCGDHPRRDSRHSKSTRFGPDLSNLAPDFNAVIRHGYDRSRHTPSGNSHEDCHLHHKDTGVGSKDPASTEIGLQDLA